MAQKFVIVYLIFDNLSTHFCRYFWYILTQGNETKCTLTKMPRCLNWDILVLIQNQPFKMIQLLLIFWAPFLTSLYICNFIHFNSGLLNSNSRDSKVSEMYFISKYTGYCTTFCYFPLQVLFFFCFILSVESISFNIRWSRCLSVCPL